MRLNDIESKKVVVVTGTFPALQTGESISIEGEWGSHPKYGKQFQATSFEYLATDDNDIVEYLASGQFPGYHNFKYVGRLDLQSRGLLLFTDDGELLYRLTHPSFEVPRSYYVWTTRPLSESAAQRLVDGVDIRDPEDPDAPEEIAFATDVYLENGFAELVLIEGKNREIRRMMRAIGYEIRDLKRVSYCQIQLGDLPAGEFRELTPNELNKLRQAVHL